MNRDVCEHFAPVDLPCDKCQPEALRLADALCDQDPYEARDLAAAAELRRQHSEIEALKAERDALKADAERYRYLKTQVVDYDGHACFPDIPYPAPIPDHSPFSPLDAAIDAARSATMSDNYDGPLMAQQILRLRAERDALRDALKNVMGILNTAESNASGNPEWDYVHSCVNAARAALAREVKP